MVSTDPISDMLTRIRNAIAVNKNEVSMPYSKTKHAVAELLASNNFIDSVKQDGEGIEKKLHVKINDDAKNAAITEITRMSRPGRRMYVRSKDIPSVKNGRGIVIVSTSKGIMTGEKAKKEHIGGELICKVY
ncbi:30S ribosomal protein S8 [Candidatus Saccharibacteria bacterium]|nr:30S ribosomal protein S8 [Candidatus Saccharibacteria bacterium]